MNTLFLCIVVFLIILAIFNLVVGVSNDAVNFLNSAIGAKVARYRTIVIIAAIGVFAGASLSNGMLDVARHGIMMPEFYSFYDVMCIFMAVMLTNVLLLDVVNSLVMPTSTTVSMVFALLGGAFCIALIKIMQGATDAAGEALSLGDLINTEKAMSVIMGIFMSVAIAFVLGFITQWLARIIFTFNGDSCLKNGIFGGIALIKIGTKKNYTKFVKDFSQLPDDMRTGLIEDGKRPVLGNETVSPMAIDPLAWHLLLILIPTGIGYLLTNAIQDATGLGVPSFSVGFLIAIVFHFLLKGMKADKYVDNRIISRMGSCATDFLVFFGVASIKIPVVIQYAVPFGLLMLFGIIWVVFHFSFIAPRLLKQEWFERGIYVYGYSNGVTAIGMALLRIVDPENKSCTLDDAAIVTPIESIIEIFALAAVPVACVQGNWVAAVTPILIYLAGLVIVPVIFKWWHKHPHCVWDETQE